jgi:saxitoxin biosynthesis operon SxtJ-like protein
MIDVKEQKGGRFIPEKITRDQAKDTGMAMVLISLLTGLLGEKDIFMVLSIPLLLINMTFPLIYIPVAKLWLGLSHLMGTIMSKVILTGLFFVLVTPVGLIRKALGADPLQKKKWKESRSTVFKVRNHKFKAEDIEAPY